MSLDGLKNYVAYLVICILWTLYGGEMTIVVQERVLFYVTKTADNEKNLKHKANFLLCYITFSRPAFYINKYYKILEY